MDPHDEMIEEWDWELARPTGRAVARKTAHRTGIPHEGVHMWIVRTTAGGSDILFQHRARSKEQYPDCLDITVGGHVVFGQNEHKIQKESWEEIGIRPSDDELIDLGYYRYEEKADGLFHREFQRVYLLRDSRGLDGYVFRDGEVEGIFAVPAERVETLMTRELSFEIEGFSAGRFAKRLVSRKDFHPLLFQPPMKAYMNVVFQAVRELSATGRVTVRMPDPLRAGDRPRQ
jgi:isopentenyldiphosphate isomerase